MSNLLRPIEAERAVLGAILVEPDLVWDARALLAPGQFADPKHERIFAEMLACADRRQPIDPVVIAASGAAPASEVSALADAVFTTVHFPTQAKLVRDRAVLRALVAEARRIGVRAGEAEAIEDAEAFVAEVARSVTAICEQATGSGAVQHIGAIVRRVLDDVDQRERSGDRLVGLSTGYPDLDRQTGGLTPGDLIVLAARPSMGKTALALNIASSVAERGHKALVFSLEMGDRQLVTRLLASRSGVEMWRLLRGQMTEFAWADTMDAANKLSTAGLWIDERSHLTPEQLVATARTVKRQSGCDLIVVDYLQLLHVKGKRDQNREREVGEISRSLKWLARELAVPVLALAQLNRGLESRVDKRPMLADLRDSGSIEQDADIVAFIYRDEVYDPRSLDAGLAEVIVAKNRQGAVGTRCLEWDAERVTFRATERKPLRDRT